MSGVEASGGHVGPGDLEVIGRQLRRAPRDITAVAVRCPFGYPAVIETAPLLGGAPNPTLFYLTCPSLATAVSRAEADGAVREFREWVGTDEQARRTLEEITEWYRLRRTVLAGEERARVRLDAGIGGPEGPERASCLHAYAAALLAVMSGRLQSGTGRTSDYFGPARRIWARFLPPLDASWCSDDACARLESEERPSTTKGTR